MEDKGIGNGCGFLEAVDRVAFFRRAGIAGGCQNDAGGGTWVPLELYLVKAFVDHGVDEIEKVGAQAHQKRLALGIAEAHVVLEHVGVVAVDHEAGIENALEGDAPFSQRRDGGFENLACDSCEEFRVDYGSRGVGPHAARVRARIPFSDAFVVLRTRQRQHGVAIGECDEGGFFAHQFFFDDDASARGAENLVAHDRIDGLSRLVDRFANRHAFSGREAIGFDHDGRADFLQVLVRGLGVLKGAVGCCRDACFFEELLGEGLAGLELGTVLVGAEGTQPAPREFVDQPTRQRCLGPDDGEVDLLLFGQVGEPLDVIGGHGDAFGVLCDSRVSRSAQNAADFR